MDMNLEQVKPAIGWIKGHLFIFVMSVLIILFLGCGWYFSGGLNTGLVSDIDDHKKNFQKLEKASKTSVTLSMTDGDFSASGTLNQALLDSLDELSSKMADDVSKARSMVLAHNGDPFPEAFPHPDFSERQSGQKAGAKRLLVSESEFPSPRQSQRENLPNKIHSALVTAYDEMLEAASAGSPPASADVEAMLLREQSRFVETDMRKTGRDELSEIELSELTSKLTKNRLQMYNEQAGKISFYASPSAFRLVDSPFVTKQNHSLAEMYTWHWDWWVAEDLISAVAAANSDSDSGKTLTVVEAPVKRIVSVTTLDAPFESEASKSGSSAGRQMGGSGRGSSVSVAEGPLSEPMVDMNGSLDADYAVSLTGRTSNKVFDVRNVRVVLIVETDKLPRLVNALGNENFITITDVSLRPASAFVAAERGFIYGANPVSRVTLDLETLWFRKWTAAWMPQSIRDALGIKAKNAG
jgi:hypothetical protein